MHLKVSICIFLKIHIGQEVLFSKKEMLSSKFYIDVQFKISHGVFLVFVLEQEVEFEF